MADLNTRNQQILGLLNLGAGGALSRIFGSSKQTPTAGQQQFATRTESVRAAVRKFGIQKVSHAFIAFTPPRSLTNASLDTKELIEKLINLRAEAVNQPGVSMATTEIHRYGVGSIEKKPYLPIFNDSSVSFIGDSDGVIHKFFYTWLSSMIGFFDQPRGNAESDVFGKFPFEVEYKDEYKTTIDIATYNEIQNEVGVIKLYNAYPIFLGEIQRNWGDTDQLVRFPVTFTYSHWTYDKLIDLQLRQPTRKTPSQDMTLFNNIIKSATALQALTSLKKPRNVQDIINITNAGSTLIRSILPRQIDY
jgi:hypothetical protein